MKCGLSNPNLTSRTAGIFYLVIIIAGLWSELFVRASLIVAGDPAATAKNIIAEEGLFRLSFAADSAMAMADIVVAILLYLLLRPVSTVLALIAMVFRLVQATTIVMNMLNQHVILILLNGTGTMKQFSSDQVHDLALLASEIHAHGYDLGLIFFGVNCLITGYLMMRSGYFPMAMGALIMLSGTIYLTGSYIRFLIPELSAGFAAAYLIPLLTETAFCIWLIAKGVANGDFRQAEAKAPAD